jgi:hypothetical protein
VGDLSGYQSDAASFLRRRHLLCSPVLPDNNGTRVAILPLPKCPAPLVKGKKPQVTCGPGEFVSGTRCKPCPEDTWQEEEKHNSDTCEPCPENMYTNETGSKTRNACQCPIGYGMTVYSQCAICTAGTYKSETGPEECKPCDFDTFQDQQGATSCKACPEHTTTVGKVLALALLAYPMSDTHSHAHNLQWW